MDCVAKIGYDVDIWTVFQTRIRVNLSVIQTALDGNEVTKQSHAPKGSIVRAWSIRTEFRQFPSMRRL